MQKNRPINTKRYLSGGFSFSVSIFMWLENSGHITGNKISVEVKKQGELFIKNTGNRNKGGHDLKVRQMERYVTMEQLIQKLQDSYHPHDDRGWLRTKAEELRKDVADIGRQKTASGIRTMEDREKLLSLYNRLALDCVKALLFIELEMPSMLPAQEQASNFIMAM